MFSVYIYEEGMECLVCIAEEHLSLPFARMPAWCHYLNTNHIDDAREINTLLAQYRHIDHCGHMWVQCDFITLRDAIHNIIKARVQSRRSMRFMRVDVRAAVVALGCTRVCSRDCLREVAGWMPDAATKLRKMFDHYVVMKCITGLYMRLGGDDGFGECIRIMRIRAIDAGAWYRIMACQSTTAGSLWFDCSYQARDGHRGAHFYMYYQYEGSAREIRFECDVAIEFAHKSVHKRVMP